MACTAATAIWTLTNARAIHAQMARRARSLGIKQHLEVTLVLLFLCMRTAVHVLLVSRMDYVCIILSRNSRANAR
eukprot:COSAG01_NODE_475_length_16519_cov_168.890621_1_plen_75_part_00